jgi:hypothetical protein
LRYLHPAGSEDKNAAYRIAFTEDLLPDTDTVLTREGSYRGAIGERKTVEKWGVLNAAQPPGEKNIPLRRKGK